MQMQRRVRALLIRSILSSIVASVTILSGEAHAQTYVDCGGNCASLAIGKPVSFSGLWNSTTNPASKVDDGYTGANPACEGSTGFCALASTANGGQAAGNYLQIDLGQPLSVKSVTVYGRRDAALAQGQNLILKLSTDGSSWTTNTMADTTSPLGTTVSTTRVARYVRVETTTPVYLSLYEIVVTGMPPDTSSYVDCGGSCTDLALGKAVSASGLWDGTTNPASKVNDGNTGTTSACEGAAGYCAIASDANRNQAVGNYLQIDLGQRMSIKSVTVYGRRDMALTQGQQLNLQLSTDGSNWTTTFLLDTTSASGLTVPLTSVARFVRVQTTMLVYLSLYEIVVTGTPSVATYYDCGGSCSNLAPGKALSASGLWNATTNPASKVNDTNTGTTPTCQGAAGYCAIASDANQGQAVGNYLQIDLGRPMSVKSVTVYGRRDTALPQGQNLNLKLSIDGSYWSATYMADTTSPSGLTVSTARLARYVRVDTMTVNYLSLYEIVVTGSMWTAVPPAPRGVLASPSSGLLTDKMGRTATSLVALWAHNASPPTANVTVSVTSSASSQGLVRGPADDIFRPGTTLLFTPSNFAAAQRVDVLGVDDGQQNGDTPFTVSLATSSADANYAGLAATLSLTNVDRTDHNVCISNVESQFHFLPGSATALLAPADDIPPDEYDGDPSDEHFESVARAKHGPFQYITTKDHNNSQLLVTRLGGKTGIEGRWGYNAPSALDGVINYPQAHIDVTYEHAGGIGTFGDYLAVPLENDGNASKVIFFDVRDPRNPVRLATQIDRGTQYGFAGAATVMRLIDGRYLVAVESNCPAEIQFYVSDGTPITGSPVWTFTGVWSLYNQDDFPGCNQSFPGSEPTVQNMTFVEECGTGNRYIVLMWNTGFGGFNTGTGANRARLYQVIPNPNSGYSVAPFLWNRETRTFQCNGLCNFAAGTTLYVSPVSRQLIMYGIDYHKTTAYHNIYPWNWYLEMGEF